MPPLTLTWPRVFIIPIPVTVAVFFLGQFFFPVPAVDVSPPTVDLAQQAINELQVVEPASEGYDRGFFGPAWQNPGPCDTRNEVLAVWLGQVEFSDEDPCLVLSGEFIDPYTASKVSFQRGAETSAEVHVDHVVALADAWSKGASEWASEDAQVFANDPLNLLPTQGWVNEEKGALDASQWLPPHEGLWCFFGVQQILVKHKYSLGVSNPELAALQQALDTCA